MDLRALSPLWLDQTSGMSIISWISALRTVSALHHAAALPKRGSLCTNRSLNAAPVSDIREVLLYSQLFALNRQRY
jgi:hypothetical protein